MKSTTAKVFLSLLFLVLAFDCAEAANSSSGRRSQSQRQRPAKEDVNNSSRVSSFGFRQVGATDLMIDIHGNNLPLPQVSSNGNRTMIVLRGVSGEAKHENVGILPMVTAVRSGRTGQDFVITIMTDKPLEPRAVRGIPPADAYTLHLKTSEETRKLIEERVATSQPQTLQVPTGPFASNTPITLDLRDADLRDVFRMFGEHVKKNIIIHEEGFPRAPVTMTFRNAPLSTVFGYIMTNPNYDLAYEFLGNDTIVIGKRTELGKLSGKMETRAYRIAYADPAALSNLLPNLTKITSANLVVDPRLRTIYATATPDVLEEVAIAVQRLDHPGKQVMIHARVLEFLDSDSLEVETALNAVYDHWAFTYGAGEISGIYADDNRIGRPSSIPNRMLPPGLANIVTPMDGVWRTFDASFRALESRGRTKTIANPSVITIDGIRAQINLTEEVPYISGRDDGGNATWSTISIGPRLSFTPRVGRDNTITLDLDLQSSEEGTTMAGSMGEIMPTSVQRQVLTNVRVRNGEPFVVGGLYSTQNINNRTRVPVLGQLPLLGELFTFRTRRTRTTQVVMVVIPYILDTPDVAVDHERVMLRQ